MYSIQCRYDQIHWWKEDLQWGHDSCFRDVTWVISHSQMPESQIFTSLEWGYCRKTLSMDSRNWQRWASISNKHRQYCIQRLFGFEHFKIHCLLKCWTTFGQNASLNSSPYSSQRLYCLWSRINIYLAQKLDVTHQLRFSNASCPARCSLWKQNWKVTIKSWKNF